MGGVWCEQAFGDSEGGEAARRLKWGTQAATSPAVSAEAPPPTFRNHCPPCFARAGGENRLWAPGARPPAQ